MDVHMLNHQLVNFMQQVLENADQSFYQNNDESANDFFSWPVWAKKSHGSMPHYMMECIDAVASYQATIPLL
jgi:hypothetical protein